MHTTVVKQANGLFIHLPQTLLSSIENGEIEYQLSSEGVLSLHFPNRLLVRDGNNATVYANKRQQIEQSLGVLAHHIGELTNDGYHDDDYDDTTIFLTTINTDDERIKSYS